MRPNPLFASDDPDLVRELIRDNPGPRWSVTTTASWSPPTTRPCSTSRRPLVPPSPSNLPTWNFTVAHCYGTPEILGEEENLAVLIRLVERFEREVPRPVGIDPEQGPKIARGTVGIRMPVSRFVCKRKLSQNKDVATRRRVIAALREPGPHNHPELAEEMKRALEPEEG